MIEGMTDIQTDDGWMDAFVVHPDENGPFPGVVVLMDIWGLREELFDIARKVAVTGYHCVVPNFWYRQGRVRFRRTFSGRLFVSVPDLLALWSRPERYGPPAPSVEGHSR